MAAPLGNQNGVKGKRWRDALHKALTRYASAPDAKVQVAAGEALDKIAERVVIDALEGDKDAYQEIACRLDGKVPQGIIGGDEDDPPVKFRGVIDLVRPG